MTERPETYNDWVEFIEHNDTAVIATLLAESYIECSNLQELRDEWKENEQNKELFQYRVGETYGACAEQLDELLKESYNGQ